MVQWFPRNRSLRAFAAWARLPFETALVVAGDRATIEVILMLMASFAPSEEEDHWFISIRKTFWIHIRRKSHVDQILSEKHYLVRRIRYEFSYLILFDLQFSREASYTIVDNACNCMAAGPTTACCVTILAEWYEYQVRHLWWPQLLVSL